MTTTHELLNTIRQMGLRPVFAAVSDPSVLCGMGFVTLQSSCEAIVDLARFNLSGSRRASLRHSVASADRAGIVVRPWNRDFDTQVASLSTSWLATKRGGEMGFTLGKVSDWSSMTGEGRVAVDCNGRVVALATWRSYADGSGRTLDIMRRVPDAPNPAMDALLVSCLREFTRDGVAEASLSAVPTQRLRAAERVYPTESLHRYKDKFDPRWRPLWMVAPSLTSIPFATRAVVTAFCDAGVLRALKPNASAN